MYLVRGIHTFDNSLWQGKMSLNDTVESFLSRLVKIFLRHGEVIWLLASSINFNKYETIAYVYIRWDVYSWARVHSIRSHKWELFSDIKKSLSLTINFKCACVYEERSPVRRIRTNHKADRFTCQSMFCMQKESFELKSNQCKIKS